MDKQAAKELLYGGFGELIKNKNFYYHSQVGIEYSRWTEEGKQAIIEYMNVMAHVMTKAEHENLDKRAKELVVKGLKGETI